MCVSADAHMRAELCVDVDMVLGVGVGVDVNACACACAFVKMVYVWSCRL